MSFELRGHTADVAVEAEGATLGDTFASVADGLTAAHCNDIPAHVGEHFRVGVRAESKEALLFEYLDELIYQRDVRRMLPADHEVDVHLRDGWVLNGYARGVPMDEIEAREIKAVTYSEMALEETDGGWRAYVVFDV